MGDCGYGLLKVNILLKCAKKCRDTLSLAWVPARSAQSQVNYCNEGNSCHLGSTYWKRIVVTRRGEHDLPDLSEITLSTFRLNLRNNRKRFTWEYRPIFLSRNHLREPMSDLIQGKTGTNEQINDHKAGKVRMTGNYHWLVQNGPKVLQKENTLPTMRFLG